jgi:hypothetical protein
MNAFLSLSHNPIRGKTREIDCRCRSVHIQNIEMSISELWLSNAQLFTSQCWGVILMPDGYVAH